MNYPLIRPKYYFSLFIQILAFIKKPHNRRDLEKSTRTKVYDTIGLYIIKLVLLIPIVLFFALIYDPENIQSASMADRFSPLVLILVGGIVLPFLEEVAFRLSLQFKPIYASFSLSVLSYYFLTKAVFFTKMSAVDDSFLIRILVSVLVGFTLYPIVKMDSIRVRLITFWNTHFRSICYVSCLIFAWMHISKYELSWVNILLLPLLTLPQLMSALIYGYIRISFGFQYPLLFHISNNFVAISLSLLPFSDYLT